MFTRSAATRAVCLGILGLIGALPSSAWARKFDMPNERFATYFGGGYGVSNVSDHAFSMSSGSGVQTDQLVGSNYAGEIGVVLTSPRAQLRLGGEYLVAKALEGVTGRAGTTPYFTMSSKISALVPKASIELPVWRRLESRISLGGGAGMASVSLEQSYAMTPAGSAALGVGDYIEKASASVLMWNAYLIGEMLFVDTTTVALEMGYRSLKVGSLTSQKATTAITGNQDSGGTLLNGDGSARAFDFGGAYVNLTFRFYL